MFLIASIKVLAPGEIRSGPGWSTGKLICARNPYFGQEVVFCSNELLFKFILQIHFVRTYLVLPLMLTSKSYNRHAKLAIRIKEIANYSVRPNLFDVFRETSILRALVTAAEEDFSSAEAQLV